MRNTQASCYGTVGNQNPAPHLPTLLSAAEPTAFANRQEDDDSRSKRLFGRPGVRLSSCGGPCISGDAIEMAFSGCAVAL